MDIRPDPAHLEQLARKRQPERAAGAKPADGDPGIAASRPGGDAVHVDPERLDHFVGVLSAMDPSDLHRVEELRERIANGSFSADPEELVDPLLEALRHDGTLG